MTENLEELPAASIEKTSSDNTDVTEKEMLRQLIEKQSEQNEINQGIIGNQQKLLEEQQKMIKKLQSIEDKQSRRKRKRGDSSSENPAKRVNSTFSTIEKSNEGAGDPNLIVSSSSNKIQKAGKWFTLKHTFEDMSNFEIDDGEASREGEHFGITWGMWIRRQIDTVAFIIFCKNSTAKGPWSIETDCEVKLMLKNGSIYTTKASKVYKQDRMEHIKIPALSSLEKWDELKQFLIGGSLTVEVVFNIKNMTGIYKNNLRTFDDTECSDVVLVVKNQKFHVSKLYLAAHSSYFKAMFLGMFSDSNKSEIPLTGIDADDFQNYLEVLYAESAVDEYTVEGILMIADMYDTQIAIRKCEEFLLEKSKKTLKKKLEMAVNYRLENLKKQCLSKIKTSKDIRAVLPSNIRDCDHSLLADLLEKSLAPN